MAFIQVLENKKPIKNIKMIVPGKLKSEAIHGKTVAQYIPAGHPVADSVRKEYVLSKLLSPPKN